MGGRERFDPQGAKRVVLELLLCSFAYAISFDWRIVLVRGIFEVCCVGGWVGEKDVT